MWWFTTIHYYWHCERWPMVLSSRAATNWFRHEQLCMWEERTCWPGGVNRERLAVVSRCRLPFETNSLLANSTGSFAAHRWATVVSCVQATARTYHSSTHQHQSCPGSYVHAIEVSLSPRHVDSLDSTLPSLSLSHVPLTVHKTKINLSKPMIIATTCSWSRHSPSHWCDVYDTNKLSLKLVQLVIWL